jgi:hypothetical protein
VDRCDRQDRRRQGKSDPLDAVSAARAALSGRALGAPKGRDGAVEAIRVLMATKRSARSNENTNGLPRQYFPKGTNLGRRTRADLDDVAAELNSRPRKTLNDRTPMQLMRRLGHAMSAGYIRNVP